MDTRLTDEALLQAIEELFEEIYIHRLDESSPAIDELGAYVDEAVDRGLATHQHYMERWEAKLDAEAEELREMGEEARRKGPLGHWIADNLLPF